MPHGQELLPGAGQLRDVEYLERVRGAASFHDVSVFVRDENVVGLAAVGQRALAYK